MRIENKSFKFIFSPFPFVTSYCTLGSTIFTTLSIWVLNNTDEHTLYFLLGSYPTLQWWWLLGSSGGSIHKCSSLGMRLITFLKWKKIRWSNTADCGGFFSFVNIYFVYFYKVMKYKSQGETGFTKRKDELSW